MPFDLAELFVLAAEAALGARLPSAYRRAMLRSNGGEVLVNGEDWQQYPIADTSDRKRLSRTANHIQKETLVCQGWPGFPPNAVAIAGNGSGDQLVFVRHGSEFEAAVHLWSHETGSLVKVANDFAELAAA
ncbi:SMI1/KNR4 family protein [Aquabacterium sp. J223]|uniref:SMI1/KNR4 family protein n=1 Tax=Aquabacterium sp. J223 TaxID=2898431 RepID=UPI0021AD7606|nr:SMI1/KNR4 family protein [Aquabacterium sp. J223]UUX95558.1 SMI1/KNR4 family protein [Aquabacterium sp. J223]